VIIHGAWHSLGGGIRGAILVGQEYSQSSVRYGNEIRKSVKI
jgi:hypothetical protein